MDKDPVYRSGAAPANRNRQPRWHYLYFVLGAFDLITVTLSLLLTHLLIEDFTGAVNLNAHWAQRLERYAHLGDLAVAVNAPGNNVFKSHDVQGESAKLDAELRNFNIRLAEAQKDLDDSVDPDRAKPLLRQLDAVEAAMKDMVVEAQGIFDALRTADVRAAGVRMAEMDQKNATLQDNITQLRRLVFAIQDSVFATQSDRTRALRKFEYLIAALILVMVISVMLYGSAMAARIKRTHAELERRYAELADARQRIVNANRVKGLFLEKMSREIGSPINTVVGLGDLLFNTKLDPQQMRYAALLKEAGNELSTQFNDLLTFSRTQVAVAETVEESPTSGVMENI